MLQVLQMFQNPVVLVNGPAAAGRVNRASLIVVPSTHNPAAEHYKIKFYIEGASNQTIDVNKSQTNQKIATLTPAKRFSYN